MQNRFGFSSTESKFLSRLNSPEKIQRFIDDISYHLQEGEEVCYSPRLVLRERTADCAEGAIFAAAVFRFMGERPLVMDLSSVRDDDHLLSLFKKQGYWGAIGKSKYTGLRFREPIYRTLRELALSYFESYFNYEGEKTLRSYSVPVSLSRFDKKEWMTSEKDISFVPEYFCEAKHTNLFPSHVARRFSQVTPLMIRAGELWMTENKLLGKAKKAFKE